MLLLMRDLFPQVGKIMDYEKMERKKLKLSLISQNVSELMKTLVETHKKRLKENKQRIKINGDENLVIDIDRHLFIQLVHNLI